MRSLAIVVMERRIRAKIQWDVVGSWGKLSEGSEIHGGGLKVC